MEKSERKMRERDTEIAFKCKRRERELDIFHLRP